MYAGKKIILILFTRKVTPALPEVHRRLLRPVSVLNLDVDAVEAGALVTGGQLDPPGQRYIRNNIKEDKGRISRSLCLY